MENWTVNNIPNLDGKIFVVTGANRGLGYECALGLAEKGATVVMACRNPERGQSAMAKINSEVPSAKLKLIELDLASLNSIRGFVESFKNQHDRLDGLINSGGPIGAERGVTADGFETHFGVNHLGHFALTGLLMDLLLNTPDGRIVTVSSRMHADGKMDWDDLMSEQNYDRFEAYRQSKLANLLFTLELSRRLEAKGSTTRAIGVHPGLIATDWAKNNFGGVMGFLLGIMSTLSYQSPAIGALSPLYAAVDPEAKGGSYYGPEHDKKGYPVELQTAEVARDQSDARRLWELSEQLTGVHYEALT